MALAAAFRMQAAKRAAAAMESSHVSRSSMLQTISTGYLFEISEMTCGKAEQDNGCKYYDLD